VVVEFELRALCLQTMCHSSSSFFASNFEDMVSISDRADPPICASCHHWDEREVPSCPSFFPWYSVSQTFFCPSWPGTKIPQISVSHITEDNKHMPTCVNMFWVEDGSLANFLPGLVLNHHLPHLSLPCSQDYRHEQPALRFIKIILINPHIY
jgi:hypothetical protein